MANWKNGALRRSSWFFFRWEENYCLALLTQLGGQYFLETAPRYTTKLNTGVKVRWVLVLASQGGLSVLSSRIVGTHAVVVPC